MLNFLYQGLTNRSGGAWMLKTILIGSCVSVQGIFVRTLADGRIVVRVGERIFQGRPVAP
jgi:hypothetical protein